MSRTYGMAPLIRGTLLLLYLALVLPLPALAPAPLRLPLLAALPLGLVVVLAISSERLELDEQGLRRRWWLGRSWQLDWSEVRGLTPVVTSQGGRVFYVRRASGAAVLLPQRLDRFEEFLASFSHHTGIDTQMVGRISPAWTYRLLAVLSAALLLAELLAAWALLTGRWALPPGSVA